MTKFFSILSILLITGSLSFGNFYSDIVDRHSKYRDCCRSSDIIAQMPQDLQDKIRSIEDSYDVRIEAIESKYQNQLDMFDKTKKSYAKHTKHINRGKITAEQAQQILSDYAIKEEYRTLKRKMKQELEPIYQESRDAVNKIIIEFLKSIK